MKKTLTTLFAIMAFVMTGCTSTVVLGPTANPPLLDVSANCKDGVSVAVPFLKIGVGPVLKK